MRFLIFRLYGPMAAYGDIAVGEKRPAFPHPTRSGVLGLLGAALGVDRHQDDALAKLHHGYGVATRLDGVDGYLSDFHTVEAARDVAVNRYVKLHGHAPRYRAEELDATRNDEKGNVTLSRRDYHLDTQSVVAVWAQNDHAPHALEHLAAHLKQPVFVLYLGRKSCPPALPLHPLITDAAHPLEALDRWDAHDAEGTKLFTPTRGWATRCEYRWEGEWPGAPRPLQTVQRRDQPHNRRRWQFTERSEHLLIQERTTPTEVEDADVTHPASA